VGDNAHRFALAAVEALRSSQPGLRIIQHTGGGSFKSQIKKADKSGARLALIVGEDEAERGVVTLKPLRDQGEQQQRPLGELEAAVTTLL
jgi:histidyl-tRNA synthetase